eukprot:TRINITY_DN568_c0_g1_i1.p1 TRINITY_DN568_c0_g1~~TRINITY_DN568_c0_g1_i1.p1  ORF type:complete len:191 (-),score=17.35 TRINITY_DN568_c0_g1_i1:66-638(-)
MAAAATWQLLRLSSVTSHVPLSSPTPYLHSTALFIFKGGSTHLCKLTKFSSRRIPKASSETDSIVRSDDDEGISLGTMKLPSDLDVLRFETLLFQWANSLCQGANLPLPVPLKVDKVKGGVRLGFISVDDGKTEVLVYIDCLVFPATKDSSMIFRAVRNGQLKDQPAPGEPRIMRSLLQALQKSVEIAKI